MTTASVALSETRIAQPMTVAQSPQKVSVICPAFNQIEVTIDFVLNMIQYVKPPHELVMVANGCTDSTTAFLAQMKRAYPAVKPIISERNRGFGGGNNLGAREAENDVHIFLSNDVRATDDFIPSILDALAFHPRAIVGARLLSHDTGWNTYTVGREFEFAGTAVHKGSKIIVPYIEGWCVAVDARYCHRNKPQNREQVGGLWDERYFPADFEDIDVSTQAALDGSPLVAIKELPLEHRNTGQTANRIPGGRLAVTLRNQRLYMEKWGFVLP